MASALKNKFKNKLKENLNKSIDGTKVKGMSIEKKINYISDVSNSFYEISYDKCRVVDVKDIEEIQEHLNSLEKVLDEFNEGEKIYLSKCSDCIYDLKLREKKNVIKKEKEIKVYILDVI